MNDDQFNQKSEGSGGTKFKATSQESGIGAGTQLPQSTLGGIKLLAYEDPKAATSFLLHKKGKVLGGDFAAAVKSSRVLDSKQKEILGEVAQLTSAIQDELPDEKASLLQEKEEGVVKSIEIRQRQTPQQQILPGQYEIVIQREEMQQSIYVSFVQAPVVAGQAPSQLLQLPSINFPGTGPIVDLIRSPAERLVKGQLDKVTKKAYTKIGKKLGGKALKKSATKIAASAAVKLSARLGIHLAANTIAPVIGEVVAIAAELAVKTAKKAVKVGKKAVKYAAALGLALLLGLGGVISAVMGQALVITLIVFPVLVAIILFIINTSAFLVPYGPEVGPDGTNISDDGGGASGSCPLNNHDTNRIIGSYDPTDESGHGGNMYWDGLSGSVDKCSYPLPIGTSCLSSSLPGSSDNYCTQLGLSPSCSVYGYALDVFPTTDKGVYLPDIADSWNFSHKISSGSTGWGYVYTSGNYSLLLLHLKSGGLEGQNISAGTRIGTLFELGTITLPDGTTLNNTHLHIELSVSGVFVKPENYLCGSVNISDLSGWVVEASLSDINNIVSTPKSEYGQLTCSWGGAKGLDFTVNANYYDNVTTPLKPAGYAGEFTNYDTDNTSVFKTLLTGEDGSYGIYPSEDITGFVSVLSAVSGVAYSSGSSGANARTAIGISGDKIYLMVLENATPEETRSAMVSIGVTNSILMDSGSSTTLCQGSTAIFGNGHQVANSIGVKSGVLKQFPQDYND